MPVLPARPVKIQPAATLQDGLKTLPLAALAQKKLSAGEGKVDPKALEGLFDNQPVLDEPLGNPEGEGQVTIPEWDLAGELGLPGPAR